jgi:diguanylate cyclase (GGDEF)-like protein
LAGTPLKGALPGVVDRAAIQLIEEPTVTAVLIRGAFREATTASRDALTGLPDRGQLERQLNWLWGQSRLSAKPCLAALFLDLNDFKRINDQWGHQVGDEALRQVAQRLQTALRADDFLARYGGDEFVALLTGWKRPDDLQLVVRRLHESLQSPLQLNCGSIAVSASIGVAVLSDQHTTPEALLHAADLEMYAAKSSG